MFYTEKIWRGTDLFGSHFICACPLCPYRTEAFYSQTSSNFQQLRPMASLSRPLREDFFLPSGLRSGSYVCSQLLCIDPYSPALPLNPCFASCLGPSRSFSQTCMISCSQVKGENPSSKGFHLLATIYLLAFSLSFLSE